MSSERDIMFPKIFMIPRRPESGCEFFEVEESRGGFYLARCRILDRYLTNFHANRCKEAWETCPYRRFGSI
ncbi:MAG: hypothetical protein F7B95_02785 [Desulfurococcales archaeon]|nr:hypothetical protein [Desulfurococcales archaeon]